MKTGIERPCANPACFCQTSDVTCSLWCGTLDRPAGVRCVCRHDGCARPFARTSPWSVTGGRPQSLGLDPLASPRRTVPGVRSA